MMEIGITNRLTTPPIFTLYIPITSPISEITPAIENGMISHDINSKGIDK